MVARVEISRHAQIFAALKAWSQWLSQLQKLAQKEPQYEAECRDMISKVMVSVSAVLRDGNGPDGSRKVLVHSAAHFLVTLTGSVRPPSIWKLREFTELYGGLHQLDLSAEDHRLVVRALTNVLLLPWPDIADQRWDERQRHLTKFLHELTDSFRNTKNVPEFVSDGAVRAQGTMMKGLRCTTFVLDQSAIFWHHKSY